MGGRVPESASTRTYDSGNRALVGRYRTAPDPTEAPGRHGVDGRSVRGSRQRRVDLKSVLGAPDCNAFPAGQGLGSVSPPSPSKVWGRVSSPTLPRGRVGEDGPGPKEHTQPPNKALLTLKGLTGRGGNDARGSQRTL